MTDNLFVFGSLLYPEIVNGLIGVIPPMKDGTLEGYRRCTIRNFARVTNEPTATRAPGHSIAGKVLCGLGVREINIFDLLHMEALGYRRVPASVRLKTGGTVQAWLYEATDAIAAFLGQEDWSAEAFERHSYEMYVKKRVPALVARWRASGRI